MKDAPNTSNPASTGTASSKTDGKDLFPVSWASTPLSLHTASRPIPLMSEGQVCPSYSPGTDTAPAAGHWSTPPGLANAVGLCGCTLWLACPVSCVTIPPQASPESGKSPVATHWSCWPSSPLPPSCPWLLSCLVTSVSQQLLAHSTSHSWMPEAGSIGGAREQWQVP